MRPFTFRCIKNVVRGFTQRLNTSKNYGFLDRLPVDFVFGLHQTSSIRNLAMISLLLCFPDLVLLKLSKEHGAELTGPFDCSFGVIERTDERNSRLVVYACRIRL